MSKDEKNHKPEEELIETQNKYLRTLAELENTRKRMQKEKSESLCFAIVFSIAKQRDSDFSFCILFLVFSSSASVRRYLFCVSINSSSGLWFFSSLDIF